MKVEVFYLLGDDRKEGKTVELGKFFSHKDAEAHLLQFRSGWHNVRVEVRAEKVEDQHEVHQAMLKARDYPVG